MLNLLIIGQSIRELYEPLTLCWTSDENRRRLGNRRKRRSGVSPNKKLAKWCVQAKHRIAQLENVTHFKSRLLPNNKHFNGVFVENCQLWGHVNFVECASCNFQIERRSVSLIPIKLWLPNCGNCLPLVSRIAVRKEVVFWNDKQLSSLLVCSLVCHSGKKVKIVP